MTTLTLETTSDENGIIHIPLNGLDRKDGRNYRVTVVPVATPEEHAAWLAKLKSFEGCIDDPTFIRHPQGEYEQRDPLE